MPALPLWFNTDNFKFTAIFMGYVVYVYLPYAYYSSGALDSPAAMFFVITLFMFCFILKGKAKVVALALLVLEHLALLFIGAYLPRFEYSSPFMKGLDFSVSFIVIAGISIMVSSIITMAYRSEQEKTQRLLRELQEKNIELAAMSIVDPLTGCYNRRYIDANCANIINEHIEAHTPLCAFILDIDHFKSINDTFGHTAGDDILKLTANTIKSVLRLNDYLIRYGGDEFVILLPACDPDKGLQIAERIRVSIEEMRLRVNIPFSVSVGVATLQENDDFLSLVNRADANLYIAKKSGRNRVVV